jgi:hypothetical protein
MYAEKNYDLRLFQNSTPVHTPFTGYVQNSAVAPGQTLGGFAMIANDTYSISGETESANYWNAGIGTGGADTLLIPIGINNVTDVQTLLNNVWGGAGAQDTQLIFDFGDTSNGVITDSFTVTLTNAGAAGSAPSGQIRSSLLCSAPCSSGGTTFASGPLSASGNLASAGTIAGINYKTGSVFSSSYAGVPAGMFVETRGSLTLDEQDFNLLNIFTGELDKYLVDVQVVETNGMGTVSQTALSAINVVTTSATDVATTPEPSTIFTLLAGLGGLAFIRLRRK